jgi:hypothetical protein
MLLTQQCWPSGQRDRDPATGQEPGQRAAEEEPEQEHM